MSTAFPKQYDPKKQKSEVEVVPTNIKEQPKAWLKYYPGDQEVVYWGKH